MDRTQSGSDVQFCVTFTHFLIDRNFTFMCVNENWQLVNLTRIPDDQLLKNTFIYDEIQALDDIIKMTKN